MGTLKKGIWGTRTTWKFFLKKVKCIPVGGNYLGKYSKAATDRAKLKI